MIVRWHNANGIDYLLYEKVCFFSDMVVVVLALDLIFSHRKIE